MFLDFVHRPPLPYWTQLRHFLCQICKQFVWCVLILAEF